MTGIEERLPVLGALSRALADLPSLVDLLSGCDDPADARPRLQEAYGFTPFQAQVVLDAQLSLLTHGRRAAVDAEIRELRYGLDGGWEPPLEARAHVRSALEAELVLENRTHRVVGEDLEDTLQQVVSAVRDQLAGPRRRLVTVTTSGLPEGPTTVEVDPVGGARFRYED